MRLRKDRIAVVAPDAGGGAACLLSSRRLPAFFGFLDGCFDIFPPVLCRNATLDEMTQQTPATECHQS